ncbi:91_t:CDS:2 [Dentiscutata erythropus]|uniref:91_t:CDS:1 n=1 Tax=Dentiscutata erythropus TaxID=1348616 RepID=A0A9N9HYC5_9GLOM|nr:91_t:CDS:2 [Dentiscutata erythropus]
MDGLLEYMNKEYFEYNNSDVDYVIIDDNEKQNKLDIDWLVLDNDTLSVIEFMWTSTTNNNHINDYKLSETNINKDSSQCVVIDYIEGLKEKSRFTDFIKNQSQGLRNALVEVIWRSRSEVCSQRKVLEAPNTLNEFYEVDQTTKSHEEALQNVTNLLVEAFNLSDYTKYKLFSKIFQNTDLGFKNLFECYKHSIKRLENIFKQDIEKSEKHNTTG